MDRRAFLIGMASGLVIGSGGAHAQPAPAKTVRLGVLRAAPDAPIFRQNFARFNQALRAAGFVEGANLVIEFRVRAGRTEDMSRLAQELVGLGMDAIVAIGPAAVQAAVWATSVIPIVAVDLESDPVAAGFAVSLARPGRNVTGVFLDFPELSGKWIQLLRELVPRLARVAVVWDPSTPGILLKGAQTAARTLRVEMFALEALTAEDFASVFRSAAEKRADAVMVLSSPIFYSARPQIVEGAARHRMPTSMPFPEFAVHGGLLAYGPDIPAMFRQAGDVMVRVLRGARAGDIPLELPARFELVVNRRTAASLGLGLPPSLLARADRVIE
ncbi:MAG TPA: ABC transporter substrate-binding protein [Methylomirabilota bacterium]|nr:ABC transporter substrate-binding protein [Methylomirabilota bacterium]